VPKAIVIVGPGDGRTGGNSQGASLDEGRTRGSFASVELLGDSLINRVVQDLKRGATDSITVFMDDSVPVTEVKNASQLVRCNPQELWTAVMQQLLEFRDNGTDTVLLMRLGPYVEFDMAELLDFREQCGRQETVRAFSGERALDLWVFDPSRISEALSIDSEDFTPDFSDVNAVPYNVEGYVNLLEHPRDIRALVVDSLNSRCRLKPQGFEVRPGVWMAEGAQVEKESRIVAPAFIGQHVTVSQQCLITRGSSIERNSFVDYGTVIEDTSVLPNSYVGIGLDVSHSIVDGNKLLNLQRDVLLEVEDSAVIRQNKPLAEAGCRWWSGLNNTELASATDESAN
jgi:carbonic anhydrase/acetyltransferase-like protein (isoleucine patch superfamily)